MQIEFDQDKVIQFVEDKGRDRAKEQGAQFSEVDYLAGAMAMLFAIDQAGSIPAGWVFGIMRGDSPLGIEPKSRDIWVVHDHFTRTRRAFTWSRDANAYADWCEEQAHVYDIHRAVLEDTWVEPETSEGEDDLPIQRSQASDTAEGDA